MIVLNAKCPVHLGDRKCVSFHTWREGWVRGEKKCLSFGVGLYLFAAASVYSQPILVMQCRNRKGTGPKCRVGLAGCETIPRVPWGGIQGQTCCQPIHKQEDEESRTNSPRSLALKDYLVWPPLSFLVLSTQTPYHELRPHGDLTVHFEIDLLDDLGPGCCLGSFSETPLCQLGH